MKKLVFAALAAAPALAFFGCSKPELDPLQFDKITKGSLICLRGDAVATLNNPANNGACDLFSLANLANETFDIEAAYLADDLTNLAEVEYFAKLTADGQRVSVAKFDGSIFKKAANETYPRAAISIKSSDILTALGNPTFNPSTTFQLFYLFIEADLTLKDGTIIPASSIVNDALFQTPLFYPAMNLRIKIVD